MLIQDRLAEPAGAVKSGEAPVTRQHLLAAVFIAFLSFSFFFIQYDHLRPAESGLRLWYEAKVAGTLSNGDQYRIGLPFLAHFIEVHTPIEMRQSIPLIEAACYAGGLICLYLLLWTAVRSYPPSRRLAVCAFFFAAVQFPVLWIFPWERPETLPTMFFLAAATLLVIETRISLALAGPLIAALSLCQSLARTDAPIFFGIATLVGIAFVPFNRSRGATALLGLLPLATGAGMHLYLVHRFPNTHPEQTEATIRLSENFNPFMGHHLHLPILLTAMLPFFFTLGLIRRYRLHLDAADWLTLLVSLLYLPMYLLLGIVTEVRIYVPYLFLLSPALAKMWIQFLLPRPGLER